MISRLSRMTGIRPAKTIAKEGVAASVSRSSLARRKAWTARVSKLNGRMIRVAGSSFITSTKTISPAVSNPPRSNGTWTRRRVPPLPAPRVRAASSIDGVIFAKLESTVLSATAMKRTR